MGMNSQIDPKTKQLIEDAESHLRRENNEEFGDLARDDVPALCLAVKEQDKRARHAEEERDLFNKRIDELESLTKSHEAAIASLSRKLGGLSEMLAAYGLPSEPKALAGAIERERTANRERIAELEAKLAEAIDLAGEAIPYVSDYFRTKYEMDASFAKLLPSQNANHNTGDTEQNVG